MKVLDHGFVELVESWGSDERIIEAARESTDKGFLGWGGEFHCNNCDAKVLRTQIVFPERLTLVETIAAAACPHCEQSTLEADPPGDEKLLAFLDKNRHTSPFEFAGAVIRVQAPIFVFREWHRHRTQSYSEISARYTPLPDVNYIPTVERLMMRSGTNKQAQGTGAALMESDAQTFREQLAEMYAEQEAMYQAALGFGIPKELARVVLPVGRYSRMRATANLHNFLHFLTLREAPNAQWEIRQYAHAVSAIVKELFPRTHALYVERTKPQ